MSSPLYALLPWALPKESRGRSDSLLHALGSGAVVSFLGPGTIFIYPGGSPGRLSSPDSAPVSATTGIMLTALAYGGWP